MSAPFLEELKIWGPDSDRAGDRTGPLSLADAEAYCRRLATSHYENFPVVSWLLPRRLHQHFFNVYAYCRWADDLGDEVGDRDRALALLAWWRGELERCYDGVATHPVFVALKETIREFAIPRQPFDDLISAFEQDQRVTDYETFAQLADYCRRSANPVGRLVLYLFRQARDEHFRWSDSICTGLQLANFWQDVARDLDIGRIYLPAEDRERFGYTREALSLRTMNAPFRELLTFEVDRARALLKPWGQPGVAGIDEFPFRQRVEIELFARGGLLILDRIEALGCDVWRQRPVVTRFDFVRLLAGAVWKAMTCGSASQPSPPAAVPRLLDPTATGR